MRVNPLDNERKHARLLARGADDAHAGNLLHLLGRVFEQAVFVSAQVLVSERLDVIQRGAQTDGVGNRGGSGFELVRNVVVRRLLESDGADHVSAALIRRHGFKQAGLAVERTDTRRPEDFVAREGVEIAIERPHVNPQVRRGLGAVHKHHSAVG